MDYKHNMKGSYMKLQFKPNIEVKIKIFYRIEFYIFTAGRYRFNLYNKTNYLYLCKRTNEKLWINPQMSLSGKFKRNKKKIVK